VGRGWVPARPLLFLLLSLSHTRISPHFFCVPAAYQVSMQGSGAELSMRQIRLVLGCGALENDSRLPGGPQPHHQGEAQKEFQAVLSSHTGQWVGAGIVQKQGYVQ